MRIPLVARLLVAMAMCGASLQLAAQQHPNIERGLLPDKSYHVADVDAVNIFNGVVNVAIPLGSKYSAGGNLTYQFTASYATNSWETGEDLVEETVDEDNGYPVPLMHRYTWTYPAKRMNAGMGWLLTLGDLHKPIGSIRWFYRAPDGAQHAFYEKLHANTNETVWTSNGVSLPKTVLYTRDGSYLRLREYNDRFELDFPDGNVHTFTTAGQLTEMKDRYANAVTVMYDVRPAGDDHPGSSMWTISDTTGRTHRVYFRPAESLDRENDEVSEPQEMVDYVELAGFDGSAAEYHFRYKTDDPSRLVPSMLMSRRCAHTEASMPETVRTSILEKIELPVAGMYYEMTYEYGNKTTCDWALTAAPGNIKTLRVPTGATISYEHGNADYATGIWSSTTPLAKRTVSIGGTVVSVTEYEHDRYHPGTGELGQRRIVREKDGVNTLKETRHYFSVCESRCPTPSEYGLPLSRNLMPAAGPFISTEVITRSANGDPVVQRATYVLYEADGKLEFPSVNDTNVNRRLRYSKTVFEDGTTSETTYSKFDGLGHYRQAITTNTNPGGGNSRTTYTGYNPGRGEFNINPDGSASGGFIMPHILDPWILGTYDRQRLTEGSQVSTIATCFDSNGFLTGRRVFANFGTSPSRQPHDLLEIYTPASSGFLLTEQYLGGDDPDADDASDGYVPAPVTSDCLTSSTTDNYKIIHSYEHGSRRASYFVDTNGDVLSPFALDQAIDLNTGLPRARYSGRTATTNGTSNADGLETVLTYDALGRLQTERAPFTASTNRGAGRENVFTSNPATVEIREVSSTSSQVLRSRTLSLDGVGRATKETRALPNGVVASRTWQYDALGRIKSLSAWGNSTPVLTRFEYDHFDRPLLQVAPDGKETSFAYPTASKTVTTTKVGTAPATESPVSVTNEVDGFGRLRRVIDADGTKTRYSYDVRDRLTHVCFGETTAGCLQERVFTYDNRGFLISEQMPEIGVAGNGTTYYRYDARGNVVRKQVGTAGGDFDVMMKYDRLGRLRRVHEQRTRDGVQRDLKVFEYGTTNAGGNYSNGKLVRAVRNNWLDDIQRNVQVVEEYTYKEIDGRIDSRVTHDWACASLDNAFESRCNDALPENVPDRKFTQSFDYDQLGAVTSLEQPSCLLPQACFDAAIPSRTVTSTYDKGWLKSVAWSGAAAAAAIDYHDNGMISKVTHPNGVKDEILLDSHRIPRPHELTTTNVTLQAPCVVPTFTTQPKSHTIGSGDLAVLTAAAVGEDGRTISYAWYRGSAGDKSTPLGAGLPMTGGGTEYRSSALTASASYWVEATNSCSGGSTVSATAVVTVCKSPEITSQPDNESITRSQAAELSVTAKNGTATYQWYIFSNSTLTAINGATSRTLTVTPVNTTSYRVRMTNECGQTTSTTATVTVYDAPTAPATVTATSDGSTNTITWSAATSPVGVDHYVIRRLDGVARTVTMPAALSFVDTMVTAGAAHLYRVRAVDENGVGGAWSRYDNTVTLTLTDFPLTTGASIRGLHIGRLRQAIDALRRPAGLPPAWSSYAPATGIMRAQDVIDMRKRLNEARGYLGLPLISFTHATLIPKQTTIFATDLQELANGVQ